MDCRYGNLTDVRDRNLIDLRHDGLKKTFKRLGLFFGLGAILCQIVYHCRLIRTGRNVRVSHPSHSHRGVIAVEKSVISDGKINTMV